MSLPTRFLPSPRKSLSRSVRGVVILAGSIAALTGHPVVRAANTIYTDTTTGGTPNWSTSTWTQSGTVSGHPVPTTTDAGNVAQYNAGATTTVTSLDVDVTLGGLRNISTGFWTVGAGGGTITLDGTGLIAGNQLFGNAGVAYIAQTSGTGTLTVNAPILFGATALDIGVGSNSPVTVAGSITATAAQTISLRGNGGGGLNLTGSIGATGSSISISNLGTSTTASTISGALGAAVISLTQNSAVSSLTVSGVNSAYLGSTTLTAGILKLGSTTALGGNAATLTINGGTLDVTGNQVLAATNAITANNDFIFAGSGNLSLAGTISLGSTAGSRTITANNNTLTLNGVLSNGVATGLTKAGAGTIVLTAGNTYTGATAITGGVLNVQGANGSIRNSSAVTVNNATLTLDYTGGAAVDRINDNAAVSLSNSTLIVTPFATSGTSTSETIGTFGIDTGVSTATISATAGNTTTLAVSAASNSFSRVNNGTALIRGSSLGQGPGNSVARITLADGGASLNLIGSAALLNNAASGDSTQALKIVPYLIGDSTVGGTGKNFLTYDTTLGLRVLTTAEGTTLVNGSTTQANPVNANAGTNVTLSTAALTVNSLLLDAGATNHLASGNGTALTVNSGAVAAVTNVAQFIDGTFSRLNLDNNEGVVTVSGATGTLTISTPIDVTTYSGGVPVHSTTGTFTKSGAGILVLDAANLYTGPTVINQGILQIGSGGVTGDLGNSTGVKVGPSGTLNYNRSNAFTINTVTGGGTVNSNNATGTLTLNQIGAGLTLKAVGGVSGATLIFGGDGTGVTSIGSPSSTTQASMQASGELFRFNAGTINFLDGGRGTVSNIDIAGATVNVTATGSFSLIGSASAPETFNMTSGQLNILATTAGSLAYFRINGTGGAGAAGTAGVTVTATQSGGIVSVASGAAQNFEMGSTSANDVSSYTLSGTGLLSISGVASLGADIAGTSTTTFNLSGGKLMVAGAISGSQAAGAKQAFVWTGGTLVVGTYTATNLTSTAGTAVVIGTTNTLTNAGGTLAPGDIGTGGRTVITGNYSVTSAAASYAVDLGGTTAATAFQSGAAFYDQTTVSGAAALGGRLNFSLINGFTPVSNVTTLYNILVSSTSVTGTFINQVTATAGNSRVVGADGLSSFLVGINTTGATATTGGLTNVGARTVALGGYQANNTYSGAGTAWETTNAGAWTNFDPGATATPATQASGAIAQFGDGTVSTGAISVSLNATRNVQGLLFSSAAGARAYTITNGGNGAIILDNTSNAAAATITDNSTSGTANAVNVPLTLTSNLTASITNASNVLTINGAIGESATGRSLTKTGLGTLLLTATNTYTGATNVNAGTLLVSGSIAGSTATVTNSGSTLGGTGTVGAVNVNNGASLQGGDGVSASGQLSSGGNITLNDGAIIKLTLGTGLTHSSLARTGGLWSFDTDQAFQFNSGAAPGTYTNIITGLAGSETGLSTIGTWTLNPEYAGSTFNYHDGSVDLVLVPEPSAALGLLSGVSLLVGLQRFRRRR